MHGLIFLFSFFNSQPNARALLVASIPAGFRTWSICSSESLCEAAILDEVSLEVLCVGHCRTVFLYVVFGQSSSIGIVFSIQVVNEGLSMFLLIGSRKQCLVKGDRH